MISLVLMNLISLIILGLSAFPIGYLILDRAQLRWTTLESVDRSNRLFAILFLGLSWSTLWLYLLIFTPLDYHSVHIVAAIKLGIEIVAAIFALYIFCKHRPKKTTNPVNDSGLIWNILGYCLAIAFACGSIYLHPTAMDNAALYWLAFQIVSSNFDPPTAQGSPFYISWLISPSALLSKHFIIGNIAVVMKMAGALTLWVTVKYFCGLVFTLSRGPLAILITILILDSFIGDYGIFKSGKESPIGMLFLIPVLGLLINNDHDKSTTWKLPVLLGLFSNLAIGFAAVTIPYLAIIYVLLLFTGKLGLRCLFSLAVTGALTIPFSFATMLHINMALLVTVYWTCCIVGVFLLIRTGGFKKLQSNTSDARTDMAFWLTTSSSLVSLILLFMLLPVAYEPRPFFPLDGESDMKTLLLSLPHFPRFAKVCNVIAFFLMWLIAIRGRRLGLALFLSFPWIALATVVVIAKLQITNLPFSPQHLWDLAKDIPNWWLPVYYAVNTAWLIHLAQQMISSWILKKRFLNDSASGIAVAMLAMFLSYYSLSSMFKDFYHFNRKPLHLGAVFHPHKEFCAAADCFHQVLNLPQEKLIDWSERGLWASTEDGAKMFTENYYAYTWSFNSVGGRVYQFAPESVGIPFSNLDGQWQLAMLDQKTAESIAPDIDKRLICQITETSAIYMVGDAKAFNVAAEAILPLVR